MVNITISASGQINDADNVTDLSNCLRATALPYCGEVSFTVTASTPPAPTEPAPVTPPAP
jgi:hypothetical protein